jgi:hypothetical protein
VTNIDEAFQRRQDRDLHELELSGVRA